VDVTWRGRAFQVQAAVISDGWQPCTTDSQWWRRRWSNPEVLSAGWRLEL